MTIRFLKTPEANVPSGLSMFVDTDGTPKLKQPDGSVAQLLRITPDKVVLGTGDPVEVADATALFGKEYDGVVELAFREGSGPEVRVTQGAALVSGFDETYPGTVKSADLTLSIPAGLINGTTAFPLGLTVTPTALQYCVYPCHIEMVLVNELYQTQPGGPGTAYTEMRAVTVSADFSLAFSNVASTPDVRYYSTPLIPYGIPAALSGGPPLTPDVAPFQINVSALGELDLVFLRTVTSLEKYWSVVSVSVGVPITVQVP